ncbi:MAG: biotin--[Blautia sp.]|nr:biotin--[acetyl-CoA-carboxylase] ligase [Blautia sp.]
MGSRDKAQGVRARLLRLLQEHRDEFLSGEEAARLLGCTRAAVWKAVTALREQGYEFEAGSNRGYKLVQRSALPNPEGIRLFLEKQDVDVEVFDMISSTNQIAFNEAAQGKLPHGSVILARGQSEGRGRKGKSFYSPRDCGLYMSVILRPRTTLSRSLRITALSAVAVRRAVRRICGKELDIKWVNDLFLDGKKVCGILTEAAADMESGGLSYAVVGIGLNLFPSDEDLPEELSGVIGTVWPDRMQAEGTDLCALAAAITNELLACLD